MYLWSCNQSLALKHAFIGQQVNGTFQNSRILRITDLHWCSNITWQYLGTFFQHFFCMHYWLHDFLPVSSTFFQFFPVSSGRNWKKYLFSSFFHSSRKKPISSGSFRTLIYSEQQRAFGISNIHNYLPLLQCSSKVPCVGVIVSSFCWCIYFHTSP